MSKLSAVVARLDRATQYSRDAGDSRRSRGVLDPPRSRGMTSVRLENAGLTSPAAPACAAARRS
ncbi:hypothetical protein XH89_11625 [Bradyrhizobium sp. CCBAU 53340]|nr:hypothetical protein XH89_11625 [Bradyrhizobium sp. CCBAU 53340]